MLRPSNTFRSELNLKLLEVFWFSAVVPVGSFIALVEFIITLFVLKSIGVLVVETLSLLKINCSTSVFFAGFIFLSSKLLLVFVVVITLSNIFMSELKLISSKANWAPMLIFPVVNDPIFKFWLTSKSFAGIISFPEAFAVSSRLAFESTDSITLSLIKISSNCTSLSIFDVVAVILPIIVRLPNWFLLPTWTKDPLIDVSDKDVILFAVKFWFIRKFSFDFTVLPAVALNSKFSSDTVVDIKLSSISIILSLIIISFKSKSWLTLILPDVISAANKLFVTLTMFEVVTFPSWLAFKTKFGSR